MTRSLPGNGWPLKYSRAGLAALLMLSIVLPTAAKSFAIGLLIVLLWMIGLAFASGQIAWTARRQAIGVAALFFSAFGLFESLYGSAHGAPGAVNVLTVYVVYPPLFFIIGSAFQDGDFTRLAKLFRFATAFVIATQVAFLLSWAGIDGGRFAMLMTHIYKGSAVVDKTESFTVFTLPNVSSLMFLAPFMLADTLLTGRGRALSAALFVLSLLACVLAGRRAIYPVLVLSIVSTAFFSRPLLNYKEMRTRTKRGILVLTILGVTIGGVAIVGGVINFHEAITRLMSLEKVTTESYPRIKQFHVLMNEVGSSPVVGEGGGAAGSYIRSNSQPWAYELTYVDLLFQFGITGCVLFACGVLFLLNCLMRAIKKHSLNLDERSAIVCFSVGFIGFVAANATNPYLEKFSYMWIIFIPVAAVAYGIDFAQSA